MACDPGCRPGGSRADPRLIHVGEQVDQKWIGVVLSRDA